MERIDADRSRESETEGVRARKIETYMAELADSFAD